MRHQKNRGFTLTEMALVLLAVTVVVSAIWVAGQHVWDNYRIYRVNQQIMTSVQNIRDNYNNSVSNWGSLGPSYIAGADKTTAFDALGLLPVEMRRNPAAGPGGTVIDHALNNDDASGSFHILIETDPTSSTATLTAFRVQLLDISQAACIKLLMAQPYADGSIGFVQVGTQLASAGTPSVIYNGNTSAAIPGIAFVMTPASASIACNSATNSNEVDFDFKLHN